MEESLYLLLRPQLGGKAGVVVELEAEVVVVLDGQH